MLVRVCEQSVDHVAKTRSLIRRVFICKLWNPEVQGGHGIFNRPFLWAERYHRRGGDVNFVLPEENPTVVELRLLRRAVGMRTDRSVSLRWQAVFGFQIVWNTQLDAPGPAEVAMVEKPF
jgi:hypothetical protein